MIPTRKYISIFHIDGQPILPPLMTIERRYEMQMYREKAIQLERKLGAERQGRKVQFCEMKIPVSSVGQLPCIYSESTSLRSSDVDEEDGHSSSILSTPSKPYKIVEYDTERKKELKDCGTNTLIMSSEEDIDERVRKLSKSKTICFDNSSNTIIRAMTEDEVAYVSGQSQENKHICLNKMLENVNLNGNPQAKKSLNLTLQQHSIPSIYVNPPTPLTVPRNITEGMSATESVDSYDVSGFLSSQATQNQAVEIPEDSVEESIEFETTTPQKRITSTARALQFGQIQTEEKNTSPGSGVRCEGGDNSSELCFSIRSPQRSATSPSLKSLSDTVGTSSLTTSPRGDDTSAHSLVRSSSFTLDGPSKVLLDHIRQQNLTQKKAKETDSSVRSPTPSRQTTHKQRSTPSPSAWRDTVESKAKRVQKKVETKPNARASSSARSKSNTKFNNYTSTTTPIWNSPLPPLKIKRSPYDGKGTASTSKPHAARANSAHKYQSSGKFQKSHAVKKSASSTTYTIKQANSRSSLPNNIISQTISGPNNAEIMAEIDKRHRQKLLTLIAQQQEEQRRLQQSFETQQRILLQQLNNERCQRFYMETNDSKEALHIEGISNPTSPMQSNYENINSAYNENNIHSYERSSPTVSVPSSYISPGLNRVISGFITTTSNELPFNVSSVPNIAHSPSQAPLHVVEVPTHLHGNSEALNGCTGNEIGPIIGSAQPQHQHSPQHTTEKTDPNSEQLDNAATVINAYARGFLVRRLFQTEQIQRIVQTIRDTLIFVLNLHMETMENVEEANTAANIKLKARLLQQLSSACRTLHLIFFQTSIKERMEIISRDRKRIKTKLLSMSLKRSPRIA